MNLPTNPDALNPDELRTLTAQLMAQAGEKDRELRYWQIKIDQLTHELVIHEHWKFGRHSEQLTSEQANLLGEVTDADLEAIETELEVFLSLSKSEARSKPKRQALPPQLLHTDIHHEPGAEICTCGCTLKRIGEDINEKLDYTPSTFIVERYIRGKWVYDQCETLVQMLVPFHAIDRDIPAVGLLAHTLVSKFDNHLPLYRQERIYARTGLAIPQSTLSVRTDICDARL